MPAGADGGPPPPDDKKDQAKKQGDGSGSGEQPPIDPIIAGLLKRLPKSGADWPKAQRKLWLQLLEGSFELIYEDNGQGDVPKN